MEMKMKEKMKKNEGEKESSPSLSSSSSEDDEGEDSSSSSSSSSSEEDDDEEESTAKKVGLFALKTAVISGAVIGGTALLVSGIGFGALGVRAGSFAASYSSNVLKGSIASGSVFSILQRLGMKGMSTGAKLGIIGSSAAVSAATTKGKKKKKKKK